MVKFDNTMKMLMTHYRKMLDFSLDDLNSHVTKTVKEAKVSGCLKFYNELLADTNFNMPSKPQLKSDQVAF